MTNPKEFMPPLQLQNGGVSSAWCEFPSSTLHGLFEEQMRRSPDAVALIDDGQHGTANKYTYAELNKLAEVKSKFNNLLFATKRRRESASASSRRTCSLTSIAMSGRLWQSHSIVLVWG